jgi:4-alpha-glucanotransferase
MTGLDRTFGAVSDPTRRGILERLGRGTATITALADEFGMTLTGIGKHVRILEGAGLVVTTKAGRTRACRIGPRRLAEEAAWIARHQERADARARSPARSPREHDTGRGGADGTLGYIDGPMDPSIASAGRARPDVKFPRSAGILLHFTSLPGPNGIGELGPDAHRFLDFLAESGLTIWQVLPIGPTGYGNSPYQCFSAFAGNPLLVHVPNTHGDFPAHAVDFPRVIPHKQGVLRAATAAFLPDDGYRAFAAAQGWWLEDYALFMALKAEHGGVAWTDWEPGAALRDPGALEGWRERLAGSVEHFRREQWFFFTQFHALRQACRDRGIRLMGDLPIYLAHDSADVWSNRGLFRLDAEGKLLVQAGVPPDYFSATGQLWGNPLYDWEAMRAQGYEWWIRRMRSAFELFDLVRVDHFRGFEAYWEVPGGDTTAEHGRWVQGPGADLLEAITGALGPLPIVAENLGVITPEVEALRERFGYPGMSILQFAFGTDGQANTFQPHTYPRDRVVYTGTHDNDTTLGWWSSTGAGDSTRSPEEVAEEREHALRYLATDGREMHWTLIRAALASVADTALIPMQDLLGLGSDTRMNLPGRQSGNWEFRFSWDQLTPAITSRLRELVELYGR